MFFRMLSINGLMSPDIHSVDVYWQLYSFISALSLSFGLRVFPYAISSEWNILPSNPTFPFLNLVDSNSTFRSQINVIASGKTFSNRIWLHYVFSWLPVIHLSLCSLFYTIIIFFIIHLCHLYAPWVLR